jgi:hypothetical protein
VKEAKNGKKAGRLNEKTKKVNDLNRVPVITGVFLADLIISLLDVVSNSQSSSLRFAHECV